jgi:hypothetical protein
MTEIYSRKDERMNKEKKDQNLESRYPSQFFYPNAKETKNSNKRKGKTIES